MYKITFTPTGSQHTTSPALDWCTGHGGEDAEWQGGSLAVVSPTFAHIHNIHSPLTVGLPDTINPFPAIWEMTSPSKCSA